jgi:hypothetical protein
VQADRALRRKVPFLIDEHLPNASQPVVISRRDSLDLAPPPAPIHFIFHSAFCCSTLLANGLDRAGLATSLKEPVILNDLVGWRQRGATGRQIAEVLDCALTLLARPFAAGEAVIVKPSNVVNGLAPLILRMRPDARALLLYAPLPMFLTSIAKKGLDGRMWVRNLFMRLRTDGLAARLGFDDKEFFSQTDLQIAASAWLAQQALFAEMMTAAATAGQVRGVSSETLLSAPEAVLSALGADFGLALAPEDIAQIVAGEFQRNAKSGTDFGRADRESEYRGAARAHSEEIDKVVIWAEAVAKAADISLDLERR